MPAYTVKDIMQLFGLDRIEVLKSSSDWIGKMNLMMVEFHDRFRPGCPSALEKALKNYSFKRAMSGEKMIVSNSQAAPEETTALPPFTPPGEDLLDWRPRA
tara:strand:+ start:193 stop:495 length:303 start_codon:yes stop_codon:yes gene_type:complete